MMASARPVPAPLSATMRASLERSLPSLRAPMRSQTLEGTRGRAAVNSSVRVLNSRTGRPDFMARSKAIKALGSSNAFPPKAPPTKGWIRRRSSLFSPRVSAIKSRERNRCWSGVQRV